MGFIQLQSAPVPNFKKAIISLWFRMPQKSLDASRAAATAIINNNPDAYYAGQINPFLNDNNMHDTTVVPLMVMGPEGVGQGKYTTATADASAGTRTDEAVIGYGNTDVQTVLAYSTITIGGSVITYPSEFQEVWHYNLGASIENTDTPMTTTVYNTQPVSGPLPRKMPTCVGVTASGELYVNFESGQRPTSVGLKFEARSVLSPQTLIVPDVNVFLFPTLFPLDPIGGLGPNDCVAFQQGTRTDHWFQNVLGIQGFRTSTLDVHNVMFPVGIPQYNSSGAAIACNAYQVWEKYNWVDISESVDLHDTGSAGAINSETIRVSPDQWHHVLISVDLRTLKVHGTDESGSYTTFTDYVDSWSFLYIAFDDKNYTQFDLTDWWPMTGGDNSVINERCYDVAGWGRQIGDRKPDDSFEILSPAPSFTLSDPSVPAGNSTVGIPAHQKYVDAIFKCEMAEFQMWCGQSIDTADVSKRRLFIDFKKGADGNPVVDKDGKKTMIPVPTSVAEKALGVPTVRFHGQGNWKSGKDTGSLGPPGNFAPTGTIKSYKPDPSIKV